MKSIRAFATLLALGIIALIGAGSYGAIHFGLFSGESKRAKVNNETTEKLLDTNATKDAKAGSVFQAIGNTNSRAPDSPQKRVIARFSLIGLSLTGAPDDGFLLELEKLEKAEIQGKLDQAEKINAVIMNDTAEMRRELARAIADKRASDVKIQQAADKDAARDGDEFILFCVAIAAAALWLYTKITHVSPGSLARIVSDIRSGTAETNPALQSIDALTSPLQQWMVKGNVWFNSKVQKLFS